MMEESLTRAQILWSRHRLANSAKNWWDDYKQTCKDYGANYHTALRIRAHIPHVFFKYFMCIEAYIDSYDECDNYIAKWSSGAHGVIVQKEDKTFKTHFDSCLHFKINYYTDIEEDMYEKISLDFVKPLK